MENIKKNQIERPRKGPNSEDHITIGDQIQDRQDRSKERTELHFSSSVTSQRLQTTRKSQNEKARLIYIIEAK